MQKHTSVTVRKDQTIKEKKVEPLTEQEKVFKEGALKVAQDRRETRAKKRYKREKLSIDKQAALLAKRIKTIHGMYKEK